MENDCGYNENKDQLVIDSKNKTNNIKMEKELENQENRNEDHNFLESFAQINKDKNIN